MRTQAERAAVFQELHRRPGTFIIPNPWDPGTARLLASLGFEALATTSLGLANMWGRGTVSADEIIENARIIAAATDLPTNGDLENCGADEPEEAAQMIRHASEAVWRAARSRISPATARTRSTASTWPSSACTPRSRWRKSCRSHFC